MAGLQELQGAFASLADALRDGFDPSADQDVRAAWLGATVHHAAVARRREWSSIAFECDIYGALIEQLHPIAAALREDGDVPTLLATLELARIAIALVGEVLDTDPCGEQSGSP